MPRSTQLDARRLSFEGTNPRTAGETEFERLRGNKRAMVFQEPMASQNQVMTVGAQIVEPLVRHQGLSARREVGLAMLRWVHIPVAEERFAMYPRQLSGEMRQRVMIAMALVCPPALLIADAPTTALDATIQILRLIDELRTKLGTAVLFITHNLAIVSEIADRIADRIAEQGSWEQLFGNPQYPYALALFAAMPRSSDVGRRLASIKVQVSSPEALPPGCRFACGARSWWIAAAQTRPRWRRSAPDRLSHAGAPH